MTIVVVDTSVLLNILDVPGRNQDRTNIKRELRKLVVDKGTELFLPLVTVVEAGNHIAQLSDGNQRRHAGQRLVDLVEQAMAGKAGWVLVPFPEADDLRELTVGLVGRLEEGISFADASIIAIWEQQKTRWAKRRVYIWSLDHQLQAYDHRP
jgi:hypothetical protein